MKKISLFLISISFFVSCTGSSTGTYKDDYIQYGPVVFTDAEKQLLRSSVEKLNEQYDPQEKMISKVISSRNYHTDAMSGVFHEVRASFYYAVYLLDLGDDQYTRRAFDVIEKTISLQDTDPQSPSCGVWPYYQEEPLAVKKSPIDYNWADFNAVSLLDIYMGHKEKIPAGLLKKIEDALILAARSIEKRNVGPGYTNIAIMGTYVTYMVSHIFDFPDLQEYAKKRLIRFYDYTLEKGGFSEYNSPTYTIVAIDELDRMKRHIVEEDSGKMIDYLYDLCWKMIARHYHKPSGQWTGPLSRAYSTLATPSFYGILKQASDGKIDFGYEPDRSDVKIKHVIPARLYPYFLNPQYPRTEKDIFEKNEPEIEGISYLTDKYAISTAGRSSLWNQRRPFLVYWGSFKKPHYLQPRLLHELYDFSTAAIFTRQIDNKVIAAINFGTNGGDTHINIDKLKEGKFKAKDLRLRFEIGNSIDINSISVPSRVNDPASFEIDGLRLNIQLFYGEFANYKGYWEKGNDENNVWLDYVIYSGRETDIDLTKTDKAALGFVFSVDESSISGKPEYTVKDGILKAVWNGMQIDIPVKPEPCPTNL
jgi:hypothetical protein